MDVDIAKFEIVAIDIVGPMPRSVENRLEYNHLLSIIDIKSRYVELIPLTTTTGIAVARAFEENWLCRYPRPRFVLTDQGKNLIGLELEELLESYGISHKYTTTYNPQSNGIIERMHATLKQHLRCL